jgi:hypothetical protein
MEDPPPIILLFYFSSPAQEVLPLTKVLIYFGHFEASSLIFTYIFAFFIFSKPREVLARR